MCIAIKDIVGVTVQCWRPPYGDVDDRVRYIAQSLGMETIIWEDNTFDYEIATLSAAKVQANYVSFRISSLPLDFPSSYNRISSRTKFSPSKRMVPITLTEQSVSVCSLASSPCEVADCDFSCLY